MPLASDSKVCIYSLTLSRSWWFGFGTVWSKWARSSRRRPWPRLSSGRAANITRGAWKSWRQTWKSWCSGRQRPAGGAWSWWVLSPTLVLMWLRVWDWGEPSFLLNGGLTDDSLGPLGYAGSREKLQRAGQRNDAAIGCKFWGWTQSGSMAFTPAG